MMMMMINLDVDDDDVSKRGYVEVFYERFGV